MRLLWRSAIGRGCVRRPGARTSLECFCALPCLPHQFKAKRQGRNEGLDLRFRRKIEPFSPQGRAVAVSGAGNKILAVIEVSDFSHSLGRVRTSGPFRSEPVVGSLLRSGAVGQQGAPRICLIDPTAVAYFGEVCDDGSGFRRLSRLGVLNASISGCDPTQNPFHRRGWRKGGHKAPGCARSQECLPKISADECARTFKGAAARLQMRIPEGPRVDHVGPDLQRHWDIGGAR